MSHIIQGDPAACFGIATARAAAAQLVRGAGLGSDGSEQAGRSVGAAPEGRPDDEEWAQYVLEGGLG